MCIGSQTRLTIGKDDGEAVESYVYTQSGTAVVCERASCVARKVKMWLMPLARRAVGDLCYCPKFGVCLMSKERLHRQGVSECVMKTWLMKRRRILCGT